MTTTVREDSFDPDRPVREDTPRIKQDKAAHDEQMALETLDVVQLPSGSVVHYHGFPFKLLQPTPAVGREVNLKVAKPAWGVCP